MSTGQVSSGDKVGRTRPSGRRSGKSTTRQAMVDAAITLFAERGYEGTTLRAITSKAGVDVALVRHFFGGKEGLFDEVIGQHVLNAPDLFDMDINLNADLPLGRMLAEVYLSVWEREPMASTVKALFRSALESEHNRQKLIDAITSQLPRLRSALNAHAVRAGRAEPFPEGSPDTDARMQMLAAEGLGIGLFRYLFRPPALADLPREEVVDYLASSLEVLLHSGK